MLIRDILARNSRLYPDRLAVSSGGEALTYRELSWRARRLACALDGLGLGKGDRVAVLTRNSPRYIELLFAAAQIGAVLVPLNHLLLGRELAVIIKDSDARALIFAPDFLDVVNRIRPEFSSIGHFLCIDASTAGYRGLEDICREAPELPLSRVPLADSDIALQVYTSGTAGRPRGAMLSNRNLIYASAAGALELGLSRKDVYLSCHALPFLGGAGRLLRFIYVGGKIVVLSDCEPEKVLRAIEHDRVTHVLLTPTMMSRILALPSAREYNLATLRAVIYGGSSIPLGLLKRAIRFFGCAMYQSYGQVESAGLLTVLHPEDHSLDESAPYMRKLTSVGQEALGVEVRVVDESGKDILPDQVGEIIARGGNIFAGYYKDPEFTAEVLRDGWYRTGDIASVDEEGFLYIVDRKRDSMMVGGISVYPREIEDVILEHPAVREAAVVCRPDPVLGEVPVAVVSVREGTAPDIESIESFCRENMAPFKVPREIVVVPTLPRNSQGKILKAKLKDQAAATLRRPPR